MMHVSRLVHVDLSVADKVMALAIAMAIDMAMP